MSMELPRTEHEMNAYKNVILSSQEGRGLVYSGKFYHLCYEPYTPDIASLKCEGVELTIKRNLDDVIDFNPVVILFKDKKTGFIESLNGKVPVPFKIRFKEQCDKMIAVINEFDEHNRKVKETAEAVVQCKVNIDNLVSEITNGQSVSYVKMLDENTQKALEGGSFIKNPKNTDLFMADSTVGSPIIKEQPTTKPKPPVIIGELNKPSKVKIYKEKSAIVCPVMEPHDEHSWQGKTVGYMPNTNQNWNNNTVLNATYKVRSYPLDQM
jgi:hypothetical protein